MKKYCVLFIFISLFIDSITAFSAEKMRIAVMDFKSDGVSDQIGRVVSNMVRNRFINSNKFVVIERGQMDMILKEQGLQQTGCTDSSCAVEIGKMLSTKKIMVGEVSTLGGTKIIISIRIVDVEKGISEFSEEERATSEEYIDQAAERITAKLTSRIEGKEITGLKETRTEKMSDEERRSNGFKAMGISIFPGLGQIVYGDTYGLLEGAFFMGVTGIFGYLTYWSYADMKKKQNAYRDLPVNLSQSQYDSKYNDANKAKGTFNIFLITTVGFYLLNFIDAYFVGSRPDTKTIIGSGWSMHYGGLFVNYFPVRGVNSSEEFAVGYMERF